MERHFSHSNCCSELNWHQNCYNRICDENKLKKAEEKSTSGGENLIGARDAETGPPKKLLRRSLGNNGRQNCEVKARSPNVLPPVCIICKKKSDLFIMVCLRLKFSYILSSSIYIIYIYNLYI